MTKIIGLTGGIGSGKTTIAKLFEAEGIPIYIADVEAKKIMQNEFTVQKIAEVFGQNIIVNNQIDNKALSKVVFNNPEKLKILNGIIHPLVKLDFEKWLTNHHSKKFVIKESAILFESGSYLHCDKIITVYCSQNTRIKRVMKRDNCTKGQVLDRIKNQWTDDQKIAKSNFTIQNEDLETANMQFKEILKLLNNQL